MKRRKKWIIALVGLPVWVSGWILVFNLTDPSLPKDDGNVTNFSGIYRFSEANTSGHYCMGNPIVPVSMIANGTDIVIQYTSKDELTVESKWKNERTDNRSVDLTDKRFSWNQGRLLYIDAKAIFGGILPGLGRQCRTTTVKGDAKNNLIITSKFWEKGLMFYIIPFWESHSYSVTLMRTGGENQNK